ncbi:FMN-dependent NADH-azoreductase [Pusillimonas caeni]|uniref:FMN-dependent NADH-azoreductase n=1 Tax=Pusillimonas caeni TaxID=1348472 RepID=UPI000E599FAF|nr:FMN-dependent NADH-azoreductase [Pusillimonas caeni]TFL13620.1 FMN-dependent NADH-azoreductase [Pusillimonas caeni]
MTTKLLHIDSAITGDASVSRELTRRIVDHYVDTQADIEVQYLDLAAQAPSHLSADSLGFRLPPDAAELSDIQRRENQRSEALISQFLEADVVVVGAPMYNFTIPSQLKAWIDRLAQAGRTFKYTENGSVGLAGGKRVIVASSRGGAYSSSEQGRALEHQESYLETIFGFFGITDVQFVRAEGVNMGADAKQNAMNKAIGSITELAALAA